MLMVVSGMAKYDAYSSSGQSINDLVADLPKSLRAVLGFSAVDLSKVDGYYALLFIYLLLMATIHAAMLGATIIAKEERDKTTEFLFSKPVSRTTVISAKLAAAFVNILIINIFTYISSIISIGNYDTDVVINRSIGLLMVGMLLLQTLFMVIGSALASVKRKPGTASSVATGILLLTYMMAIAIDLNEKMENLKYVTPFKYVEAKNVLFGSGLEARFVLLSLVLIVALTIVTYHFFEKRDLNA